jgi:hypothetical protein
MARWLDRPRVYPHKCALSSKGDIESGPYFEYEREYFEQPSDDATPCRFYITAKMMLQALAREDSPIKVMTEEQFEALTAERDDLAARVSELESEADLLSKSLEHERDVFARARVKAPTKRQPRGADK